MSDYGTQQPSSPNHCGLESESHSDLRLEKDADSRDPCRISGPALREEGRCASSCPSPTDSEDETHLSCGDHTDSGIDVSNRITSILRRNEKRTSLLQWRFNESQHQQSSEVSGLAVKQPLPKKLVEARFSALLLRLEKLHVSWPRSPGHTPHSASMSRTELPGDLTRRIPRDASSRDKVHIGSNHRSGGSGRSHRNSSGQCHDLSHALPDDDDFEEHEVHGDPQQPSAPEDSFNRYPCIFHRPGSVDPTPGCARFRKYTSWLRTHHFHGNHPGGPFGCCSRCFASGQPFLTIDGQQQWRRFTTKAEVDSHERTCIQSICIDETCTNYDNVPPLRSPCQHGPRFTQKQIWRRWYRRAHGLGQYDPVPEFREHPPQHLRLLSTTGLARTQSSPGYARSEAASNTTPTPQTNAILAPPTGSVPSPQTHTASSPTAPAPMAVMSTRDSLIRLVTRLLRRLQSNPPEPDAHLRRLCRETLHNARGVLQHPHRDPEYAASIQRLGNLVVQCWRLLARPTERTPEALDALATRVDMTLQPILPVQPSVSRYHEPDNLRSASASSSFNGVGTVFDSDVDLGTQQQQQHAYNPRQHQPLQAFDATIGSPTVDLSIPTITLSDTSNTTQAGASPSHPTNFPGLGTGDQRWQYANVSNQPWDPNQMRYSQGNLTNPTYDLPQNAQAPPHMANNSFSVNAQAHFQPNQAQVPLGSLPSDWDAVSRVESGAYSENLSFSFDSGERDDENGEAPASDDAGGWNPLWQGGSEL